MKIRVLSKQLQEIAETELNETSNRVEESLETIRDWLSKQEHLKCRNDDQFLLSFLRGSKFSIQRTKEKLDSFCTFKTLVPEWSKNMDPYLPLMQLALKLTVVFPLSTSKSNDAAPRVLCSYYGAYDPDELTLDGILMGQIASYNILFNTDDNLAVSGGILVWDMKGLKFKTVTQGTPTVLKKLACMFQNAFPTRIKGIYIINVPKFCEELVNFAKRFLSNKLNRRVHVYSTNNLKEILKHIPKSILPQEYGGDAGPCEELRAEWKKVVEGYRDMLLQEDNYYSDESKRPEDSMDIESILGITGSFRNLNVD